MPPKKRYQWDTKDSEFEDDRPSRSQKKRDSTALQRMGEELTTLGSSVLAKMPLTPNIREAILEWQRLSSHEGRRRSLRRSYLAVATTFCRSQWHSGLARNFRL